MPEGDTIHRTARTLRRALASEQITAVRTDLPGIDPALIEGRTVEGVEARGKHLLIGFDDGRYLHSHMRMSGSWHVYRCGERWRRPTRQLRIALETTRHAVACFNAPVVELLTAFQLRAHRQLQRLGPDLLAPAPDFDEIARRAAHQGHRPVGELLLAQDVACGIGNIYKSETLFIQRIDPFLPASQLSTPVLRDAFVRARDLMLANLETTTRTTRGHRGGPPLWVYGRQGDPCLVCATQIRMRRQGEAARSTYFCPECQVSTAGQTP